MLKQKMVFQTGDELVATACKQINYDIMPYYPITASTQIAENIDILKENENFNTKLILADGEHSAFGMCYGASIAGGRVLTATSGNGLLYALEQMPVQSGTRFPIVLNIACTSVSAPMSIKCEHSDIMYALNTGYIILFAKDNQEVYDFNIIGLKLAEKVNLPVIIAFDGFFISHQKKNVHIFDDDKNVLDFIGEKKPLYNILDTKNPIAIGSYMTEIDMINNKYQLHKAMEEAREYLPILFKEYYEISGRAYAPLESYMTKDAEIIIFCLGSTYETVKDGVEILRKEGKKVGVFTSKVLRPSMLDIEEICKDAKTIICLDRQDSYGANGGNMSIELKASLQEKGINTNVITRIYGLSGKNFYKEDAILLFNETISNLKNNTIKRFDYYGKYKGDESFSPTNYLELIQNFEDDKKIVGGHGACSGCGIFSNLNILLKSIKTPVVLLFQTGCGSIVSSPYPKNSFKASYVHNLLQNGAPTLDGIVHMYEKKHSEDITFVMVSGDGALDIGIGSCLASGIRKSKFIIFEYDNCGYMTTGNQNSYSTFLGAKTGTSSSFGSPFIPRDTPMLFDAINIPYIATVSESYLDDFIEKSAKAFKYSKEGLVFIKCLSVCPLNWKIETENELKILEDSVKSCYFPLYEIEKGKTRITYNPEDKNQKIDIEEFILQIGSMAHLKDNKEILEKIKQETNRKWQRLKEKHNSKYL